MPSSFPLYTLPNPPSPSRLSGLKFVVATQSSRYEKILAVILFFPFPIFLNSSVMYLCLLLSAEQKNIYIYIQIRFLSLNFLALLFQKFSFVNKFADREKNLYGIVLIDAIR